jgi:5,10-methylene-tetrahydrofolate dehydrogenase/methenyl tetrahydrofolate cyclohydrolase
VVEVVDVADGAGAVVGAAVVVVLGLSEVVGEPVLALLVSLCLFFVAGVVQPAANIATQTIGAATQIQARFAIRVCPDLS